jgi:hypothetical protein
MRTFSLGIKHASRLFIRIVRMVSKSVCYFHHALLCLRMHQRGFHWRDYREIYAGNFCENLWRENPNLVTAWWKYHFTWRPKYVVWLPATLKYAVTLLGCPRRSKHYNVTLYVSANYEVPDRQGTILHPLVGRSWNFILWIPFIISPEKSIFVKIGQQYQPLDVES